MPLLASRAFMGSMEQARLATDGRMRYASRKPLYVRSHRGCMSNCQFGVAYRWRFGFT
jgi:hypothetical protein